MAASKEKIVTKKVAEKKPAAPKKTATKSPASSKSVAKPKTTSTAKPKSPAKKPSKVSPEQHYKMVEVAAYYIAEKNSFSGNPSEYWAEAEAQINTMMTK